MTSAFDAFSSGELTKAISLASDNIRENPGSVEARWELIMYLSFTEDLERAEKHVRFLMDKSPDLASQMLLQRSLLSGEIARRQCFNEGRLPEFTSPPDDVLIAALKSLMKSENKEESTDSVDLVQNAVRRPAIVDGQRFESFRDQDDLCAVALETITLGGKYYWIPVSSLIEIELSPLEDAQSVVWRQAELRMASGESVSTYLPGLYPGSYSEVDESIRCGRAAEFPPHPSGLTRGIGAKLFQGDNTAVPFCNVTKIEFLQPGEGGRS